MEHLIIGVIVGLIMGLSGAGGALVAIPLFIHFTGVELNQATTLSLIAVLLGSAVNLSTSRQRPNPKLSVSLVLFATLANGLLAPIKAFFPQVAVVAILSAVALYSLWSVWRKPKTLDPGVEEPQLLFKKFFIKAALSGVALGALTTLTGLGGGVLLIPLLLSVFSQPYHLALPTSLLAIGLTATTSLYFQRHSLEGLVNASQLGLLALGIATAALSIRYATKRAPRQTMVVAGKLSFTAVAVYAVATLALSAF